MKILIIMMIISIINEQDRYSLLLYVNLLCEHKFKDNNNYTFDNTHVYRIVYL